MKKCMFFHDGKENCPYPSTMDIEVNYRPNRSRDITVRVGSADTVKIDKLHGPTIACNLRIAFESGYWVIARWRDVDDNGNGDWEEIARVDCQESLRFPE
jgi:hypothetical protein